MRRDARTLADRAVASFRRAAQAFNSLDDDGRVASVLLHTQHAFEMLLKAILVEKRKPVFDQRTRRSIGFETCLGAVGSIGVGPDEIKIMRTIDALRDEEQHWLGGCDEGLLYWHMRAAVTVFDDLLDRYFGERLASRLPTRVLPIASEAPRDISLLMDDQFEEARRLLEPGRRARTDARNRIRTLLALEGLAADEVAVSDRDVARVERGIRRGLSRAEVFPRLDGLHSTTDGTGLTVRVSLVRRGAGMPVRMVGEREDVDAAAIREVDLHNTFKYGRKDLADLLGITTTQCKALRAELGVEDDDAWRHDFPYGSTPYRQYSDAALGRMRDAMRRGVDWEELIARHRNRAA